MSWNSTERNRADCVRDRLLANLAAQGVLTDALRTPVGDDDEEMLEIEITDFEGSFGGDDRDGSDEVDELDDKHELEHELEHELAHELEEEESEARESGGPRRHAR